MKRFVSIFAAIAMLFVSFACAEGPSKTLDDVGQIGSYIGTSTTETGETIITMTHEELTTSGMVYRIVENSELTEQKISAIRDFLTENISAAAYFPAEVQEAAQQLLPEDVRLNDMIINEAATLYCSGYQASFGDIKANFEFITKYTPDQECIVLIGLYNGVTDENGPVFEWYALAGQFEEDGSVTIQHPSELMLKLQAAQEKLLVLFSTNK